MPAYFSIDIQIKKSNIYHGIFRDFVNKLSENGFKFVSGIRSYKEDSLDEIIEWNEAKIKDDYELGYEDTDELDFKQICFDYDAYSEVRLFILNYQDNDYFTIFIIIPENDIIDYSVKGGRIIIGKENRIRKFMCSLWEKDFIDTRKGAQKRRATKS